MSPGLEVLLLVHAAATLAMTGLIWFVQLVHYPLFSAVGAGGFREYAASHRRRTAWVVGPLMLTEVVAATLLIPAASGGLRASALVGWMLIAVIWASTAFVQVPLHRQLGEGLDQERVHRLVATNWLRTLAWSLRSAIALALLHLGMGR